MASVRILIVDDFKAWRGVISAILGKVPRLQVICEVDDGLEAVLKAEELKPDLILLDIGLPTLNGIDAARQIWRLAPKSKIIFVTQQCDPNVVQQALDMGALGYVRKSDVAADLLTAVDNALLNKRFVSPRISGVPLQKEPIFAICFGVPIDKNTAWMETVEGFSAARERME
jgi:DNA-binding NarL/FixJ family response regulator